MVEQQEELAIIRHTRKSCRSHIGVDSDNLLLLGSRSSWKVGSASDLRAATREVLRSQARQTSYEEFDIKKDWGRIPGGAVLSVNCITFRVYFGPTTGLDKALVI